MLTREENELLTRVGPGTAMGDLIRRFWIPACLSEELPEPDCDPIRVRLLGEDLVAFRDSSGRVGLVEEHCPHRGASLLLGRNEFGGLRCLYHGWKIDVSGNVLETPCEPTTFRVRQNAYPAFEQGDVVWAYMGPREKQPPFPNFWWSTVPAENRCVGKIDYGCNYLQAIEGVIDSSHADLLHSGYEFLGWTDEQIREVDPARSTARTTRWEAEDTAYGFRYAAIRNGRSDPSLRSVRITEFAVPFFCLLPDVPHMFVPADDGQTWFYDIRTSVTGPVDREGTLYQRGERVGIDVTPDRHKLRTLQNGLIQDRAGMRARKDVWSFSGIAWGKPHQDIAVIESMGPIYDRTKEHLGIQDVGVVRMRQRMLTAVHRFMETGEVSELDPSIPYDRIRGDVHQIPIDTPWQTITTYAEEPLAVGNTAAPRAR